MALKSFSVTSKSTGKTFNIKKKPLTKPRDRKAGNKYASKKSLKA